MKDSLSAFFSPQSPLRLLWRLFCEWEEEQELSGINVLFYRGCFFSLLVSICQWGERVEWVWGSFHREGLLWTLWIGKERVTLAVHNEKKKKRCLLKLSKFWQSFPYYHGLMFWCWIFLISQAVCLSCKTVARNRVRGIPASRQAWQPTFPSLPC